MGVTIVTPNKTILVHAYTAHAMMMQLLTLHTGENSGIPCNEMYIKLG